jgi:tetratricopeptide (TPR) repeat protein
LASLIAATLSIAPLQPARAQAEQAQPALATYADALAAGKRLWLQSKPAEARMAYEAAFTLAKTPGERADARFGTAETYPKAGEAAEARADYSKVLLIPDVPPAARVKALIGRANTHLRSSFPSGTDINAALESLDIATKVENASDQDRAFAHVQRANLLFRTGQVDKAQLNLAAILALPEARPDQKADALIGMGNFHFQRKELVKARAAWAQVPELMVSHEQKVTAYRSLAQSYVAEKQVAPALAELEKAVQLPGLGGGDKAVLLNEVGGLQLAVGQFTAARESFTKIVALPDAGAIQKRDAAHNVGRAYAGEKNYTAARSEWEKLAVDKSSTHAVQALHSIALSHAEEKHYPEARAAIDRWLGLPQNDYWKEDGWQLLGQVYELESNWTAAQGAYQKLIQLPQARSSRKVRAIMGLVRTHEAEKNAEAALQDYTLLPEALKSAQQRSPAEMAEVDQLRSALTQHLGKLAAGYSKETATLPAAITLYRTSQKLQLIDAGIAAVTLDLGDLLLSHGMLDEAKAEYQKVAPLRFAGDEQKKKAVAKLKEIEEKKAAG